MRICFIAPANNYHTQKWCKWFSENGHDVHVVSFRDYDIPKCTVHYIPIKSGATSTDVEKLGIFLKAKKLREIVDDIKPEIINVHYATSYGTVAALSGIKPYILSVWGSDIYDFPKKSFLHKMLLKFSLNKATWLFSTSRAMAEEGAKYTKKRFEITPFGVDMELFNPLLRTKNHGKFVIGTVSNQQCTNEIGYLLKAVSILRDNIPEMPIELRIAGEGVSYNDYKQLSKKLHVDDITVWLGFIPQEQVAQEWAHMDVAVVYSNQECFVASAVEAQACGTALIVSDSPGLRETTIHGKTSLLVPPQDEHKLAEALRFMYMNPRHREKMGRAGREFVTTENNLKCHSRLESRSPFPTVDYDMFKPLIMKVVIGTVKSLSPKYGIDYLIKAFADVRKKHPEWNLELRIAGKGPSENEYKKLAMELGVSDYIKWLGFISQEEAAVEWANMDLGIVYSTLDSESFGVSAVECNACGTPVVISDVPGLMEATSPDQSSVVVPRCEVESLSSAIANLCADKMRIERMGQYGRAFAKKNYALDNCFKHIESLYTNYLTTIIEN